MGDGFLREAASPVGMPAAAAPAAPAPAAPAAAAPDIAAAMAVRSAGENFPVALRLLPARHRRHLMAVYGFARTVDDIGDLAPAGDRARLLDDLEAGLGRLYSGEFSSGEGPASEPSVICAVIRALRPAVTECAIPVQPFLDLIQANRQDQIVTSYRTFDELRGYCRLSANPVGRIVLHVFGAFTPARAELSDHVCTALQLAEHWQDVGEDFRAGRVYLPGEDMARYGCSESELAAPRSSAALRVLMAFETGRAGALLDAGAPLVGTLRGFARVAVAGYVAGGRAALAAIAAADHDVLRAVASPRAPRTAAELLRCYVTGR